MLLAIQRGFVTSLPWSPLSFAIAISTALIPGTSWETVVLPALGTALLMTGIGWGLDTIFKPKLTHPPRPRAKPHGTWALMLPLVGLLAILVTSVLIFGALITGKAPFGYVDWLGWFAYTAVGNLVGGLLLVTLLRLVRSKDRLQEERRDAETTEPGERH